MKIYIVLENLGDMYFDPIKAFCDRKEALEEINKYEFSHQYRITEVELYGNINLDPKEN